MTTQTQRNSAISYALRLSGLVLEGDGPLRFYLKAFADHPQQFVSYKYLRQYGTLFNKDELSQLDLRTNIKLSVEFFETLNESGRLDPMTAASVVGLTISKALCTLRDVDGIQRVGIRNMRLVTSNMASGPCKTAKGIKSKIFSASEFSLLPLIDCSHPDQCACRYLPCFDD